MSSHIDEVIDEYYESRDNVNNDDQINEQDDDDKKQSESKNYKDFFENIAKIETTQQVATTTGGLNENCFFCLTCLVKFLNFGDFVQHWQLSLFNISKTCHFQSNNIHAGML
jgi:hypothetical protein